MAFHDPDSNLREHAMALKEGRQKRIQVIDGQQVEVFTGVDDEEYEGESDYEEYIDGDLDDEPDDPLVAPKIEKGDGIVAIGDDGQRYMVVEVINMDDEEHQESQDSQEQPPSGMEIEELILPEGKSRPDRLCGVGAMPCRPANAYDMGLNGIENPCRNRIRYRSQHRIVWNKIELFADMDNEPMSEPPTARKISGKQQAGKDMEDYFGFEVSHKRHQATCFRDVVLILIYFSLMRRYRTKTSI